VIANLNSDNACRMEDIDLCCEVAGTFFDVSKCPQHPAIRCENRWAVTFPRMGRMPRSQQGIARFHLLRETEGAITFHARFRK
jgi:hypothetical protein